MDRIGLLGWIFFFLAGLVSFFNPAMGDDGFPLPHNTPSNLDPQWIHRLPPATLSLPKSSNYREIPRVSPTPLTSSSSLSESVATKPEIPVQRSALGNVPPILVTPTVAPVVAPTIAPWPGFTEVKPEISTQRGHPGNTSPALFPLSIAPIVSQHKPFEIDSTTPIASQYKSPEINSVFHPGLKPTQESIPPVAISPVAEEKRALPVVEKKRAKRGRFRVRARLSLPPTLSLKIEKDREQVSATGCTEAAEHVSSGKTDRIFWQVQLMESSDVEQLKKYRRSFIGRYGDLLRDHEPEMIMNESADEHFYLRLKPIPEEMTANNWCATLKERGGDNCLVLKRLQVAPTAGWQLQIIAKRDLVGMKTYREYLASQHANLFKNYRLVITVNEPGEFFRLRLKSIPNEAAAKAICMTLRRKGSDCIVMRNTQLELHEEFLTDASGRLCTTIDKKPEDGLPPS